MPTYDYHCTQCQTEFTVQHKINDPKPACPDCGGGEVKKKLAAPGNWWYCGQSGIIRHILVAALRCGGRLRLSALRLEVDIRNSLLFLNISGAENTIMLVCRLYSC